jgi:hypothetical protein
MIKKYFTLIWMNKPLILFLPLILLAIILMQSGCNEDSENDQYPDVTASSYTISGTLRYKQTDTSGIKLADWPFGPAMLRVVIGGKTVATTALQSDGNFMVILPGTVSGNNFTKMTDIAITYGGNIMVTPETVKYVNTTQFMVDYTENNTAKSIVINQVILNSNLTIYRTYYYYFYDNEGSVVGKGTAGNTFNWIFTKGWGMVESDMSTGSIYIVSSKSVNAAAQNAVWTN